MITIFELPRATPLMAMTTLPSPANDRVGAWSLLGFGLILGFLGWAVFRAHLARRRRGWAIPHSFCERLRMSAAEVEIVVGCPTVLI